MPELTFKVFRRIDKSDSKMYWWALVGEYEFGPYDTKAEAEDDAKGVAKFYQKLPPESVD